MGIIYQEQEGEATIPSLFANFEYKVMRPFENDTPDNPLHNLEWQHFWIIKR